MKTKRLSRPWRVLLDVLLIVLVLVLLAGTSFQPVRSFTAKGLFRQSERENLRWPSQLLEMTDQPFNSVSVTSQCGDIFAVTVLYYKNLPLGLRYYTNAMLWREVEPGGWGCCYPHTQSFGLDSYPVTMYVLDGSDAARAEIEVTLEGEQRWSYRAEAERSCPHYFTFTLQSNGKSNEEHDALYGLINGMSTKYEGRALLRTYDEGGALLDERELQLFGGDLNGA